MKKGSLFVEIGIFVGITYILSWLLWMPALLKVYGVDLLMQEEVLIKIGDFMPSILVFFLTTFNAIYFNFSIFSWLHYYGLRV